MNTREEIKPERYRSRYTRNLSKSLVHAGLSEAEKYVEQFYVSEDYQSRLESISYLLGVLGKHPFPETILSDALKDSCSQVKIYVLRNYDFSKADHPEAEACLAEIARNDEKLQLRVSALEQLSRYNSTKYYDLFFSTSLLKSSKESAAGLLGLFKLDKSKAYQMAKFRAKNSNGSLDLAIALIFTMEGNSNDLNFFKSQLKGRSRLNKIHMIRLYLKMLSRVASESLVKSHILYICEDIFQTQNTELVQGLIMELYQFIASNQEFMEREPGLLIFLDKTINQLLEKDYLKARKADPFGPL